MEKRCNWIAQHAACETVAMGETLTGHIRSKDHPSVLLTKVVTGQKCKHLVSLILYDIYHGDS